MTKTIPSWALRPVTEEDRERVARARSNDWLRVKWPGEKVLKAWARKQGWPTPWLGFEGAFEKKMLESDETFALAMRECGIEMLILIERYRYPDDQLEELDRLYNARDESGRPTGWGVLVAGLRDIRRAVEAGVVVEVDGKQLRSFSSFYTWAHDRYHLLEDGYDSWIGDDS